MPATRKFSVGPQFRHREAEIYEKWRGKNSVIPVNEQQHSFDTPERQAAFVCAQYPTKEERARYERYRQEWYRRAKEFDPGEFPLAVGLELVSTCNLGCTMCYTITDEFQNSVVGAQRMLPWKHVIRVIDECAALGVCSILFSWRGESTLYKSVENGRTYNFADALAYARNKGILEVSSLTHGQMIDQRMAEEIVEAEPNWINVSIDGLGDVYNKIRTPRNRKGTEYDAFKVVTENVKRLVHIRNARGKTRPQIRTNTIFPPIANDPDAYYRFMVEIGVDWVTVNEILDFRGSGNDGEELPVDAVRQNWACQYPFQRLMLSANGVVVPCTGAHNEEISLVLGRYLGTPSKAIRNVRGDIEDVSLPEMCIEELWHCRKLQSIRELHRSGMRTSIKGCRNCRHGAVKHGVQWVPESWDMAKMEWDGRKFRNG